MGKRVANKKTCRKTPARSTVRFGWRKKRLHQLQYEMKRQMLMSAETLKAQGIVSEQLD